MNPFSSSCLKPVTSSSLFGFLTAFLLCFLNDVLMPPARAASAYLGSRYTEAMLTAIEATTPLPASAVPRLSYFHSAKFWDTWPPLPSNVLNLPCWPLANGHYLVDDRNFDYDALRVQDAETGNSPKTAASSILSSIPYANPVYLTNLAAAPDGSAMKVSFSVAGGTNNVPHDILMSTNIADAISQWTWSGIGYTSNNYTLANQPLDKALYILAKPQKTMVVGWGNDSAGQCDVPPGITNALQVTGGGGQSLALLSDGSIVAWGQNAFGEGSVPPDLAGVTMVSAGWYHDVALLSDGTVTAWGLDLHGLYNLTEVPSDLTDATVISVQALHSLALRRSGTVVAWGYGPDGEATVPAELSNVVAIAAGYQFNVVAKSEGTVTAWGNNSFGQCDVPAGLSNVVNVAAGPYHSLALLNNGTVVAWGDGSNGQTNVPRGLTNVVAIAAGGDPLNDTAYSLALGSDGTLVAWGSSEALDPLDGLTNVIAIAAGADHALAVRTGPPTPVITLEPADQYQIAGGNITFTAKGTGLYSVSYQWQSNSVNIVGETNTTLTVSNVQPATQGVAYGALVGNDVGSIVSSNAYLNLVTPPVIVSQAPLPTNQVVTNLQNLTLTVTATGVGQFDGFPLSYQWRFNGTNISGATSTSYTVLGSSNSSGIYSSIVSNAAGGATVSWSVTLVASYLASGTLAYHLSTNAVARTNGFSDPRGATVVLANWTYDTYSGANLAHLTNAVWSTNFWLHGVQGLSSTCIGYSNGVGGSFLISMVSPRHYLVGSHVGTGPMIAFLDTNNIIYWRTSLERVDIGGDTSVGVLDSDLPPSVGYLPVVPTNLSTYLPTGNGSVLQGIGMNQDMRLFSQPMTLSSTFVGWNSAAIIPFGVSTNWSTTLRGGDSSDPEMLLIDDQLVLLSHAFTAGAGPNYASQFNLINQKMHYLSTNNAVTTDYHLTPFSLTNWPAIQ